MRFYGGLYIAVGLFLILATTDLRRYHTALNLVFAMIFTGGLARLTMLRPATRSAPRKTFPCPPPDPPSSRIIGMPPPSVVGRRMRP